MAETFAGKLRNLRAKGSYSRRELSEASGVSEGAIRDYERGQRAPSLEAAARLAYALNEPLQTWSECLELTGAYRLLSKSPRAGALEFGRYKGRLPAEVPVDYLDWIDREEPAQATPRQLAERLVSSVKR